MEGVELTGIYAHCGNTYGCKGEEQIKAVAQKTTTIVLQFVEKYAFHVMSPKNKSSLLLLARQ